MQAYRAKTTENPSGDDRFGTPQVKPATFAVVHSKPYRGLEWRVSGYANDRRQQYWWATKTEAQAYAKQRNLEREIKKPIPSRMGVS